MWANFVRARTLCARKYKIRLHILYYNKIYLSAPISPINESANNVIEMDFIDYVGNLAIECRPCKT